MWALAAAARQEIGAPAAATAAPAAAVSSGAPPTPAPAAAIPQAAAASSGQVVAAAAASTPVPDPGITQTYAVHPNPYLMAVSADGRYVYSSNLPDSSGTSGVSILDTAKNTVSFWKSTNGDVYDVAAGSNGNVYVLSNKSSGVLTILNPNLTSTLGTVAIPKDLGTSVSISRDGKTAVVGGYGGTLSLIDTAAKKVTKTVNVGSWVYGSVVSPDSKTAWVNTQGGTGVAAVNLTTGAVTAVKLPSGFTNAGSVAISPNGSTVYVGGPKLAIINAASKAVTGTVDVLPVNNATISRLLVSPDGKSLYASERTGQTLSVINLSTNKVMRTVSLGGGDVFGMTLSPDGSRVYAAESGRSTIASVTVSVVPTATNLFTNMNPDTHDKLTAQLVQDSKGTNRMVVYMTGVDGNIWSGLQGSFKDGRDGAVGWLNPKVSSFIDGAYETWKAQKMAPTEIMLVGFSGGGEQMQNYAAQGNYKNLVKTTVLFGAPLTKTLSEIGVKLGATNSVELIVDLGDQTWTRWTRAYVPLPALTCFVGVDCANNTVAEKSYNASNADKGTIWWAGKTTNDNTHNQGTYLAAAQEFDKFIAKPNAASYYRKPYNDWQRFAGTILSSRTTTTH